MRNNNRFINVFLVCLAFIYLSFSYLLPMKGVLRFIPTLASIIIFALFGLKAVSNNPSKSSKIFKLISLLVFYIGLISVIIPSSESNFLITILKSCLWGVSFLLFYYLLGNSPYEYQKKLVRGFWIIGAISLCALINTKLHPVIEYDVDYLVGDNNVFYFISVVPWLLLSRNNKNRLFAIALLLCVSFISLKRSAVIIALGCSSIYLINEYIRKSKSKLFVMLTVAALLFFLYFMVKNQAAVVNVEERFDSIGDDEGSGRIEIFGYVYRMFFDSDIISKLFGHGYNMVTVKTLGTSAHNDFLEVLYDYGIVGLVLYFSLHYQIFKTVIRLYKARSSYFISYAISWIIFIIMSLFSHLIIYPTYFCSLLAFWAYIESLKNNNVNQLYNTK